MNKEQGEGRFMMNMLFKQFMNSFIREGIAITNAEKLKMVLLIFICLD